MIRERTALEWGAALRAREVGVVELTRWALDALEEEQPRLNAVITLCHKEALAQAERVQRALGSYDHPLAGVPMGVKDNLSTRGIRTTCASRMLEEYVPIFDATVVERLHRAGAVCVAKLNMDEFAMGSTNESSFFGAVANPWDLGRSPGGSSGGSAAAVAVGALPYALGSDTGGSIRQPCGFCGITGLKPSYGAVSRWGLIAYASSLDQVGPMARTAEDCGAIFGLIAGRDPRDGTSLDGASWEIARDYDVGGLRVGLPRQAFDVPMEDGVREAVLAAAKVFEDLGAVVEWMDLPLFDQALPAHYVLASAEAASNLSRYDGLRLGHTVREPGISLEEAILRARTEGFGWEVKRRLLLGNFVVSRDQMGRYYEQALKVRALICREMAEALSRYDLLLTPVAPATAPLLGQDVRGAHLGDVHTVAANMAGLPALALPAGLVRGLPVGLQLTGRAFGDAGLLSAGAAFQRATAYHRMRPEKGRAMEGTRDGARAGDPSPETAAEGPLSKGREGPPGADWFDRLPPKGMEGGRRVIRRGGSSSEHGKEDAVRAENPPFKDLANGHPIPKTGIHPSTAKKGGQHP